MHKAKIPSPKLASYLRGITGLVVVERKAEETEETACYDGIWACASPLHLDDKRLDIAMNRLRSSLKPGGIIYVSFVTGQRDATDVAGDGAVAENQRANRVAAADVGDNLCRSLSLICFRSASATKAPYQKEIMVTS